MSHGFCMDLHISDSTNNCALYVKYAKRKKKHISQNFSLAVYGKPNDILKMFP